MVFDDYRSNRYPCLNNIPNYQSLLFKDLNNERRTREFPGFFSDLDDQCRRAFGIRFEYCKDLSHSVSNYTNLFLFYKIFVILLAEMSSSLLSGDIIFFINMYN